MQNEMKDRLVEVLKSKTAAWEYLLCKSNIEALADYLVENGVIVPPCKVGDTVYSIYQKKVIQGTVRLIRPFISKEETVFKGNVVFEVENPFFDDGRKEKYDFFVVFEKSYGSERIAFLTKEEAEKVLKER